MLDKAWRSGIEVTKRTKGGKAAEVVTDFGRFVEILGEVQKDKAGRPHAWFEACRFTGICPRSIIARVDIALALQMYNYCAGGFSLTFPYPEKGYGGQAAIWYDVVGILSEAHVAPD